MNINETPEQEYERLYLEIHKLCIENGWGDPSSFAVSREIFIANTLGHKKAPTYSGADAIDEDGECEYKSTIGKNINGTYNGISVQPTWEEQIEYLRKEKIGKYKNHYIVRFSNGKIVECYRLNCNDILDILLPKLKRSYFKNHSKKDPRLGASVCKTEIYKYGERLI